MSSDSGPVGSRFYSRFFWRLVIAFALVILLAAGGIFLAGRASLGHLEQFAQARTPALAHLWADRLARYYGQHSSWEGVESLIAGYPCGPGWEPWDQEWQGEYILAASDGTIVAASDSTWLSQTLSRGEQTLATPVEVDGRPVGLLLLPPLGRLGSDPAAAVTFALQRFLWFGLPAAALSLIVGLVISHRMSRPLVNLTTATRAIAAGNLDVRVPVRHRGEVRELAVAFNTMAAELARAEQLRRSLTADVAHELRTPLSVIRGKLEGIADGVYPATPEHLEPVLEEMQLLTQVVEDLRLLALAEAGQLPLEKRAMDVGDLLRDTQVNFTPQAADRGVVLALDLPAGLPPVMADPRRIAQVLGNLLTNALNHTPPGGRVTVSTTAGQGVVEVAVADTGTGIPAEDLPNIFERFWRGEKSRSRAGGGTGLGLAIVKQLVELHGGTIRVESSPGRGTEFRFTLPTA